ncbi:endonuclease [Nemorincola caseinilytica]|uniref:Endonuclease n=2 Tax=Nemorincola caseinilytica TaxID=2054315 RepID=A0ABP8NGI3_9BACT
MCGCAGGPSQEKMAIVFYNCENFFDTVDDPLRDDDEFTPWGKYQYTRRMYLQKLHNMAIVLQSMGGEEGPVLIGLAEIENNTVLNDLVQQPEIAGKGYSYQWYDGPDARGVDVALLYDPIRFVVIESEPLHVPLDSGRTRDILYVQGVLAGDTVHVLVNHWPSRRGADGQSAGRRAAAAKVCRDAMTTIWQERPGAHIIVMGDLNDNPADSSISKVLGVAASLSGIRNETLYNPFAAMYARGEGTEAYMGQWNLFDQVMVSGGMRYAGAGIYRPPFLQSRLKGYEGTPKRSFISHRWVNGYSDHFPVVLYLYKK